MGCCLSFKSGTKKPVILFYPPTSGKYASLSSFTASSSVTLNPSFQFTKSLLPRPQISEDKQKISWDCVVQKRLHQEESALLSYNGRNYAYLFYEFVNRVDVKAYFMPSLIQHANCAYLLNGIEAYEDWCHVMLGALGLSVRERDDFITFWAHQVEEEGTILVARVVPEEEIKKIAELSTVVRCEDGSEVPTSTRRVYITFFTCKTIPSNLSECKDKFIKWNIGDTINELPEEIRNEYPINRDPNNFVIVEWGATMINI